MYVVVRRCQKRSLSHEEKKKILRVKRLLEKTITEEGNINVEVNTQGVTTRWQAVANKDINLRTISWPCPAGHRVPHGCVKRCLLGSDAV